MTESKPLQIPEHLAKGHARIQNDESAAESARQIGRNWVETFIRHGGLCATDRILDIGCGPGRMAIAIGERFGGSNPYLGFDVSAADISFCQDTVAAAFNGFRFEHLDVRNHHYNPTGQIDPLEVRFGGTPGAFDFAFATSVFTHFFRDETLHYLAEAHRMLAHGGRLLATFFLLTDDARLAMAEGRARFRFTHPVDDEALAAHAKEPGKAVAFRKEFILTAFEQTGFTDVVHVPGVWAGAIGPHGQDIVTARKP